MAVIPITNQTGYNQKVSGFFGEFGAGGDTKISFIQTGLKPAQLEKVKLISEIRGSEKWSVRDLFQREVNNDRVTNEILPYIRDRNKVKFFNPLTITLLPLEDAEATSEISREIPEFECSDETDSDGHSWVVHEALPFYSFRHIRGSQEYGYVEWNEEKVRAVAIDGQHRLSALKRCYSDPGFNAEFSSWTIPVVIFALRSVGDTTMGSTILNVVRNIFIYINTQALKPSPSREIILSDESINSICAQELLEYSHQNDVKERAERDEGKTPLLFYGWRDLGKSAAYVKSIEEIKKCLETYILGEDFSEVQRDVLQISPNHPLNDTFSKDAFTSSSSTAIREIFRENVLLGITHFMENFTPYQIYSGRLRELENEMDGSSDLARHAFALLRFGEHNAPAAQEGAVEEIHDDIIDDHILHYKEEIPDLLLNDIGMRAVFYALGEARILYAQSTGATPTWLEYAEWFTKIINVIFEEHWFDGGDTVNEFLLHLSRNENDGVVNYRVQDVKKALGPFVVLLVAAYGRRETDHPSERMLAEILDEYLGPIEDSLSRGYKKEARSRLRTEFPAGPVLNQAVTDMAQASTAGHSERIRAELTSIAGQ
tara:strand:- start:1716 stop:3515 length:1800 start_codon:yes stop_codon:yes gene_type:complete